MHADIGLDGYLYVSRGLKTNVKTETMLERLKLILRGRVSESALDSDSIVSLDKDRQTLEQKDVLAEVVGHLACAFQGR